MVFVMLGLLLYVAYAAIAAFGWFNGLAILAAVWLLMPVTCFKR